MIAIDVVPDAAREDRDVVGEIEDGGDEGKTDEEEDDGVCNEHILVKLAEYN